MGQTAVRGDMNPVYLLQATGGWNQGRAKDPRHRALGQDWLCPQCLMAV